MGSDRVLWGFRGLPILLVSLEGFGRVEAARRSVCMLQTSSTMVLLREGVTLIN